MLRQYVSLLIIVFGLIAGAGPVGAEMDPGEKTPEDLFQEFMSYAEEYKQDALKMERQLQGADREEAQKYRTLAGLYRQMATQKERMASGYRANNLSAVKQAEAIYFQLRAQEDRVWGK